MKQEISELKNLFYKELESIKDENKRHKEAEEQLRNEIKTLKTQINNIEQSNSDEKLINQAILNALNYEQQVYYIQYFE